MEALISKLLVSEISTTLERASLTVPVKFLFVTPWKSFGEVNLRVYSKL